MLTLLEKYSGGPVGVNTIAASIDEEADTIEEVYEPYLMQLGFIDRTPRGRIGTDRAFDYFQIPRKMRGGLAEPTVLKHGVFIARIEPRRSRGAIFTARWNSSKANGVRVLRRSSIYETEPQDLRDQPWFLNIVVEAETEPSAGANCSRGFRDRGTTGPQAGRAKGPRTIDIDILFYGNAVIETAELQIPHPRLTERRFVLEPLAELAPQLQHPITGRTVVEMLSALAGQQVRLWN